MEHEEKDMMNKLAIVLAMGLMVGLAAQAEAHWAEWRGAMYYWADEVTWSGAIQNFGPPGTVMDETTRWWLLGAPDADPNDDDYWSGSEPDYLGGWKGNDPGASLTFYFNAPIQDLPGDDVVVRGFRGPSAEGSVWASSDGVKFMQIGTITSGTPRQFENFWFDLNGTGLTDVHYIELRRVANGSTTGAFFDAVGVVLEEPDVRLDLLTSGDAVDWKPCLPSGGDWLIFTADDLLDTGYNDLGAVSYNFPDAAPIGGSAYTVAPSLSGSSAITMDCSCNGPGSWTVDITAQLYMGQASPIARMNQILVTPNSPAALNPLYLVGGLPNSGTWSATSADNWSISYAIDFYFAAGVDDADPWNVDFTDIDSTYNDATQEGYLIPVALLTPEGMAAVELSDPTGFFGGTSGEFEQYLLTEIAPRLPAGATYLLFTQMLKINPVYAETGMPITTASLIGNTTFAYTTQVIIQKGDIDADGDIDLDDLPLFLEALLGEDVPLEHVDRADMNDSSTADGLDVQPFVDALLST
jgi:hypothetical protein